MSMLLMLPCNCSTIYYQGIENGFKIRRIYKSRVVMILRMKVKKFRKILHILTKIHRVIEPKIENMMKAKEDIKYGGKIIFIYLPISKSSKRSMQKNR